MTPCGHLRRLASAAFCCVARVAPCAASSSRPRSPFFAHPRIQAIGVWALLSLSIWSTEFSSSSSGGRPRALATARCAALREGVSGKGKGGSGEGDCWTTVGRQLTVVLAGRLSDCWATVGLSYWPDG